MWTGGYTSLLELYSNRSGKAANQRQSIEGTATMESLIDLLDGKFLFTSASRFSA